MNSSFLYCFYVHRSYPFLRIARIPIPLSQLPLLRYPIRYRLMLCGKLWKHWILKRKSQKRKSPKQRKFPQCLLKRSRFHRKMKRKQKAAVLPFQDCYWLFLFSFYCAIFFLMQQKMFCLMLKKMISYQTMFYGVYFPVGNITGRYILNQMPGSASGRWY